MEIEENYIWKDDKKRKNSTIQECENIEKLCIILDSIKLFQKAIENRHLTDEIRNFAISHIKKLYTLANTTKTTFLESTLTVMNVMQDILLNEGSGLLLSELTRKTRQKIKEHISHTYILHIIQHRQEFKINRINGSVMIDIKR